ncbi:MAG TPA: hypothetical protein VMT32_12065 [Bryobacteraceae bacterium]|nr:hypothetical protein [Bryobacteraceae bacterium]
MRRQWLLLLLALWAAAAPPRAGLNEIRVPVWLEGDPSSELAAADFHATIDGAESRVLGVQCPDDELILLLVLDLSSGDLTILEPARQTLVEEIHKLPPKTYVGLLRAQDGLLVLSDPTTDREAIAGQIQLQTAAGKTSLLPTVDTACRIADSMLKKSAVRTAVLYVTDGDVRNYREDFTNPVINSSDSHDLSRRFPETLVQEKIAKLDGILAAQQAPLMIVDLNQRTDRLNEAYNNGLKQLADTTGGMAFFSRSTTDIPGTIRQSLQSAQSHYSLTLSVPERIRGRLQIRISTPDNVHTLNYRTHLVLPWR